MFLNGSILYLILKAITAWLYFLLYVLNYDCYHPSGDVEKTKEHIGKRNNFDSWNTPKGCGRLELPPLQTLSLFCICNTTLLLSYLHMCFVTWRLTWVLCAIYGAHTFYGAFLGSCTVYCKWKILFSENHC